MKVLISFIVGLLFSTAVKAQVVINELLPDPSPVVNLPDAEFIELYNVTTETVSMAGWSFSDSSSEVFFGDGVEIPANSYLILTDSEDVNLFSVFGNVVGISGLPTLNNNGDIITLKNANAEPVDRIAYDNSWYNDAIKDDGGWTLERINPFTLCGGANNWSASNHIQGGSPGEQNSIFDEEFFDSSELTVETVWLNENEILEITFNKVLNETEANQLSAYQFQPSIQVQSISVVNGNQVNIQFFSEISENTIYELLISDLPDCEAVSTYSGRHFFGIPQIAVAKDLLLNELLFNPASGGVDFIEIVNNSDKLLSFNGISVVELNPTMPSDVEDYVTITDLKYYLLPDSIYVLTTDPSVILEQYLVENPTKLLDVSIPNYADDEGIVGILNEQLDTIDQLHYYEDWHYAGLSDINGVSLERLSLTEETQTKNNWHSASYTVGFASPTAENSQNAAAIESDDILSLSDTVFTPDQDGQNDFLTIQLNVNGQNNSATVQIFNVRGYPVSTVVNNQLIDSTNEFRWDGLDNDGQQLPIGHYIIVVEVYNSEGNKQLFKEKVVLSRRSY